MDDSDTCHCNHVRDEHEHPKGAWGSTKCTIEGCDCIAFEHNEDADAEED